MRTRHTARQISGFLALALAGAASAATTTGYKPAKAGKSRGDQGFVVTLDAGYQAQARRITPKAAPVVSIASPANNAAFVAPASITINATASVTGATLTKVEFLRNGTLLATDTTAPYSYTWTNVAAGTYALTAKADDNAGGTTTSAAVNITVKANV